MAITQDGGHEHHHTVDEISDDATSSSAATSTTGMLARSDKARLSAAFPASPIIGHAAGDHPGSLTPAVVANQKRMLLMNSLTPSDIGDAESYYAFPDVVSTEEVPSSPDLSFGGAPNIVAVATDVNGHPIASPYIPNLVPPDSFNPTVDNVDLIATQLFTENKTSFAPGTGDGLLNPSVASKALHNHLVPAEGDGDSGVAPFTGAGSGGTTSDGS